MTAASTNIDMQSDLLVKKIKKYLITIFGHTLEESSPDEFYRAFCYAIREQIMINWQATAATWQNKNSRMVYYLSMEFLPGRFLNNNVMNLNNQEVIARTLAKTGHTFSEILRQEADPGLGNGGLGRLAACFLDSLATLKIPSRGYGLRYQYGLFEQQLWDGLQIERPDCWLWAENPWEFRRDLRKTPVKFCGTPLKQTNTHGDEIYNLSNHEEVWALPYDIPIIGYSQQPDYAVTTLRLWSTKESPRNFELQRYNAGRLDQAAENTTLTDVLYPNDQHETGKRVRLKQEFLLVSASLQDIFRYYFSQHSDLSSFQDKVRIQINDTHPAVLISELMRLLTKRYNASWNQAWEITQAVTSYTNHTILAEALEVWDQTLFRYLLPRQYSIIEHINHDFCNVVREKFPHDEYRIRRMSILENNQVRMAHLAIIGSHKVNGVAKLHSEILKKRVFKDFYELYPDRFINITNGVTPRRWLQYCNPLLSDLISSCIGDGWKKDFSDIQQFGEYAGIEKIQSQFLEIKKAAKNRFLEFLHQEGAPRDATGAMTAGLYTADSSYLFDVQVKRIHEYKRQLLNALHLIILYHEVLDNPTIERQKRLAIFSGKAAASYETAKSIIRLIHCIAKKINANPLVNCILNVAYIENYNVSRAELIIPSADLSEQISTAGMEASGTGNMKFSMNGALTIGTEDGANIEMRQAVGDAWWPFRFGASAEELEALRKPDGKYSAWNIYSTTPMIKRAIDALKDHSIAESDQDHQLLSTLYYSLLEGNWGSTPDRFFVLQDLMSYYEAQKKVEKLYKDPKKWAEYALHNIAGMGLFSTDRSIQEYAHLAWNVEAVPIEPSYYQKIVQAYHEFL
ncbi:MAG: glycogen/starch/alpha-glucan family phosphorylase [Chlamydia sp.]